MVVAQVGKPPVQKNVAMIAVSVALALVAGALGGGTSPVGFFVQGHAYFVVTDRRLLIFGGRRNRSGPGRLLGNVPRHAVTLTRVTDGLSHKIRFRIAGSGEEIRLRFPPLNRGARRDARALVALLEGPPHPAPEDGGGEARHVPRGSGRGHRAARGKRLSARLAGLSWWQVVLVLLPFALVGVGVALLLSKPAAPSQATPAVTPTTPGTSYIQPTGDDFTPNTTWAPEPSGVAMNEPSVLRSTGAALSWPAYVNTSGSSGYDLTAYKVYRSASISFDQSDTTLVASLAPGITSFVDHTTHNPYGGGVYYYMVDVQTKSGALINGAALTVDLPAAGQTVLEIPAVASGTLSAAYPNTVADPRDGAYVPRLEVGADGGFGVTRAVFGFGALDEALPSGATVVEAHLSLSTRATSPLDIRGSYTLYGLSRSFMALQATWDSAAPGIPWTIPGGDYATTPTGASLPEDQSDPSRWDFDATAIVRGWVSDPGSEHGLLLRENRETDPQQMAYFAPVSNRIPSVQYPVLIITYTVSGSAGQ